MASAAGLHPSLGGKGWLLAAGGLGALALLVGVLGGAWLLFNFLKPATHTLAPTSTPLPRASFTFTPGITSTLTPGVVKGIGSTQVSPTDGMVMVYVPEGDFRMGSDKSVDSNALGDEIPQHKVYLDAFWIDRTEVTNAQYTRCVSDKKCTAPHETKSDSRSSYYRKNTYSDYPVIYVDWTQANAYCAWAGRRLPTEAEWEKAARGPDGRIYPWGNQADNSKANYKSNDTTQVGSYPSGASPYEAWDMAGNVWEWVADWYSATYYQDPPPVNPKGPDSGSGRVRRGGGWFNFEEGVRTAYRIGSDPMNRDGSIGFRCAASPAP
jgi:serine/threonine-protein kinase